jgi:DNA-binding LacI/PurR family transcriptional regulator
MPSNHRATLQTIANEAEVCKATVSLALRNHPSLPAATIERIRKIAQKVGYQTHPYVSALMAAVSKSKAPSSTATIAFLSGEGPEDFRREPRRHLTHNAARARAESLGYSFEHFWVTQPGMSPQRLEKILIARGIFGLVLGYFTQRDFPPPEIQMSWEHFACVVVSQTKAWPAFHRVYADSYGNTMLVLNELQRRGYSRIGLAMDRISEAAQNYLYRSATMAHALRHKHEKLVPVFEPADFNQKTFTQWYKKHRPDVVISVNPEILTWIQHLGLRVPEDAGYVNLSLVPEQSQLSGTISDADFLGACVVDLLDAQLRRNERGIPLKRKSVLVSGYWNEGGTLRGPMDEA